MSKLANVPVIWKTLGLVAILSSVTIGGAFYSTNRMRFIDTSYNQLLDGYGAANLAMARANRSLVFVDRSIFRLLAEEGADNKKEANQEAFDAVGYFKKELKIASNALPGEATAIAQVGQHSPL